MDEVYKVSGKEEGATREVWGGKFWRKRLSSRFETETLGEIRSNRERNKKKRGREKILNEEKNLAPVRDVQKTKVPSGVEKEGRKREGIGGGGIRKALRKKYRSRRKQQTKNHSAPSSLVLKRVCLRKKHLGTLGGRGKKKNFAGECRQGKYFWGKCLISTHWGKEEGEPKKGDKTGKRNRTSKKKKKGFERGDKVWDKKMPAPLESHRREKGKNGQERPKPRRGKGSEKRTSPPQRQNEYAQGKEVRLASIRKGLEGKGET